MVTILYTSLTVSDTLFACINIAFNDRTTSAVVSCPVTVALVSNDRPLSGGAVI